MFFSTPFSLGRHRIRQEVQSTHRCLGVSGPTRVRREPPLDRRGRHLRHPERPGLVQQPLRHGARSGRVGGAQRRRHRLAAADLRGGARPSDSAAVMLICAGRSRLRPERRDAGAGARPEDARRDRRPARRLPRLPRRPARPRSIAFRRPVAYVHGDSHYFRIDKPLLDAQGRRLENFTRVETFGDNQENGDNDVHWVKVARRPAQPRRLRLPAADRARQPDRQSRP